MIPLRKRDRATCGYLCPSHTGTTIALKHQKVTMKGLFCHHKPKSGISALNLYQNAAFSLTSGLKQLFAESMELKYPHAVQIHTNIHIRYIKQIIAISAYTHTIVHMVSVRNAHKPWPPIG